jgi:hypothetical protein
MRQRVWPAILAVNMNDKIDMPTQYNHEYVDQIEKDVDRSLYKNVSSDLLESRKSLSQLMNIIFQNDKKLHYFQGFHDIASVFLLVLGFDGALKCLTKFASIYLVDSITRKDFELVLKNIDQIYSLLVKIDPTVSKILKDTQNERLHFAFPWVLTWFSHQVEDLDIIARIFDLFLADIQYLKYLTCYLILSRKKQILSIDTMEFSEVFQIFKKIEITEEMIQETIQLYQSQTQSNNSTILVVSLFVLILGVIIYMKK